MRIAKYIKGDRVIWLLVGALLLVSLLSVFSSTGSLAYKNQSGNTFYYLFRQLRYIILGVGVIYVTHLIPYQVFSRLSVAALYVAVPLLLLTLFVGTNLNEATRWLEIPGVGLTIQPSDFAKIAIVMYLARLLAANQDNIREFKSLFPRVALVLFVVCGLILPANFSTAAIVFVTAMCLLFVGRVPFRYLTLIVFMAVLAFSLFIGVALVLDKGRVMTWKARVENFASGEGDSYQADQAKVAVVQGGLLGKGPGSSTQRNLLPHPYSDFIYAIIIEEYGSLVGGLGIIMLYLIFFYRAGMIIRRSKSTYGAFLAFGLSTGLVLQALINMAVAVGLFPVTGQTLPLVSMGGSSIVFTSLAVGMILSVSWGSTKDAEADESEAEASRADASIDTNDLEGATA